MYVGTLGSKKVRLTNKELDQVVTAFRAVAKGDDAAVRRACIGDHCCDPCKFGPESHGCLDVLSELTQGSRTAVGPAFFVTRVVDVQLVLSALARLKKVKR